MHVVPFEVSLAHISIDDHSTRFSKPQKAPHPHDPAIPLRISDLPPELLSYIFLLGADIDPMIPIRVSHVCRGWRNLALYTPALWRRISLDARLRMWMERVHRARACTLDIVLASRMNVVSRTLTRRYLDAQSVQLYMHCMVPYIHQWRSLTIEFQHYAPYLWNAALSSCCDRGQAVHALQLEEMSLIYPHNDDSKEFVLFGGYAPRLRAVTVHGIRLTWLPTVFGNLTFLDYTHHGFTRSSDAAAELLYMLQVSNRLQDLRVSFTSTPAATRAYPTPFPADESAHLPYLTSLEVRIDGSDIPSALVHFMAHLSIPATQTLRLLAPTSVLRSPRTADITVRLRQLLKALPRLYALRHLEVEHTWLSDPRFIFAILHVVPNLKHLTLRGSHVTNPFFFDLGEILRARFRSSVSYGTPLVLDVIELDRCDTITAGALADAVKHRLGGNPSCIHQIYVRECISVDVAALRRVKHMNVRVRVWQKGEEVELVRAASRARTHRHGAVIGTTSSDAAGRTR